MLNCTIQVRHTEQIVRKDILNFINHKFFKRYLPPFLERKERGKKTFYLSRNVFRHMKTSFSYHFYLFEFVHKFASILKFSYHIFLTVRNFRLWRETADSRMMWNREVTTVNTHSSIALLCMKFFHKTLRRQRQQTSSSSCECGAGDQMVRKESTFHSLSSDYREQEREIKCHFAVL